jgi:23S rRNA pseudouridine1911/1915/1917 synthase
MSKNRIIVVSPDEAGRPVVALLKTHLRLSWSQARHLVEKRRVRQGPRLCRDPQGRVRAGQKIRVRLDDLPSATNESLAQASAHEAKRFTPPPGILLRYSDDHIVVVEKPAGLTTMRHAHEAAEFGQRGQRFLPATLCDFLPDLLAAKSKGRGRIIAVHRLDRDTSGLVIFARTPAAARHLGTQFRGHSTERTYVALVRGRANSQRIESQLIADRGDGRRGTTSNPREGEGQRAITHVRVVEELGDYTLVECRPETGRTHQIRIHLGECGTPICGERIYERPLHGKPLRDASGTQRLALHASRLSIEHPATGKRMRWTAPLPVDMLRLLKSLRRSRKMEG